MGALGDVFQVVFSVLMGAAAAFFLHKVLWLVRYRKVQRAIVEDAERALEEGDADDLAAWEEHARQCWTAAGDAEVDGPASFIRSVEASLVQAREDLRGTRKSVESLLVRALEAGARRVDLAVFSLGRLVAVPEDSRYRVGADLSLPAVTPPALPDQKLYEVNVKSRYGALRRALVFFSGAADMVYSSQHVARMSQNAQVPTSVLFGRLSLVFLLVLVVGLDLTLEIRQGLSGLIEAWLWPPAAGDASGAAPADGMRGTLSFLLGMGVWLGMYGSIYLAVYLALRRKFEQRLRRLRVMVAEQAATLESQRAQHMAELLAWARGYGRSLDSAVDITVRHAEQLIDHAARKLRRRIAGTDLFDGTLTLAESLFRQLPVSSEGFADVATSHPHTFRHYVWPRPGEMDYQFRLAQYRAAWQHLQAAAADLHCDQPDPERAQALWRSATWYAHIFAAVAPPGLAGELRAAYARMVTACVADTDRDLRELDARLGALERSLNEQLEAARGLIVARVELTNGQLAAAGAALSAEIVRLREEARLEAMAFEI